MRTQSLSNRNRHLAWKRAVALKTVGNEVEGAHTVAPRRERWIPLAEATQRPVLNLRLGSETSSNRHPIAQAHGSEGAFVPARRFVSGDEEIGVEAMLALIELIISPASGVKR